MHHRAKGECTMSLLSELNKNTLPPDGGERFNRLIFARSPYLLQHAENPVDWYEWGDAAFDKARSENRPVFLSIGYATCHWCHVMAHESFMDTEVATLLNRHFVAIKVDREERPDIDDFYMTASQLMGARGGWPLNIFMTPDRIPFMAITYLPRLSRDGMTGFLDMLANIAALWRQRPDLIQKNRSAIMEALGDMARPVEQGSVDLAELSRRAMEQIAGIYDVEMGGFGGAPKFPMPPYLIWLIGQGRNGNRQALDMALNTLRRIRMGGIWDHLGGGVHRYAVDRAWLVPHFEKMLYDQALVALAALDACQADGDAFFLHMAEDIFSFAEQELRSPEGGFCSALDADSEGVEGKYYLWDKQEIDECLGPDAPLFRRFYDVRDNGNFEGQTILNMPETLEKFCGHEGCTPLDAEQTMERCRLLLLERRKGRVRPFRDAKVVTAWNGLMIAALAKGGMVGNKPEYLERAGRVATFILDRLRRTDGRLLRSYLGGPSGIPAFLEDYACLCFGLLELFNATLEPSWLDLALGLAEDAVRLFQRREDGCFTTIGSDAEQMPAQVTLDHDGVTPSAASLMVQVLIRLARACDRPDLLNQAATALTATIGKARHQPLAHLGAVEALALLETEPVVITFHGDMEEQERSGLAAVVRRHFLPNLAIRSKPDPATPAGVQVCGAGTCYPVISNVAELDRLLGNIDLSPAHSVR